MYWDFKVKGTGQLLEFLCWEGPHLWDWLLHSWFLQKKHSPGKIWAGLQLAAHIISSNLGQKIIDLPCPVCACSIFHHPWDPGEYCHHSIQDHPGSRNLLNASLLSDLSASSFSSVLFGIYPSNTSASIVKMFWVESIWIVFTKVKHRRTLLYSAVLSCCSSWQGSETQKWLKLSSFSCCTFNEVP